MADPATQLLVAKTLLPMAGGALLGKAMAPKAPKAPEVKQAPMMDDKARLAAQQRANSRQFGQSGRIGTVMSGGDNNKLG